jgi:hypothetical protein
MSTFAREVIYAFPKGMTCNNKSFNDESDGTKPNDDFELKTTIAFDVTDLEGTETQKTFNLHPFIVWEVAVDDENDSRDTDLVEKKVQKDLSAAFKNMMIASAKKKKETGTTAME